MQSVPLCTPEIVNDMHTIVHLLVMHVIIIQCVIIMYESCGSILTYREVPIWKDLQIMWYCLPTDL